MLTKDETDASGGRDGMDARPPRVAVERTGEAVMIGLAGDWTTKTVSAVDARMRELAASERGSAVVIDASAIGRMDTAGAWLVERLLADLDAAGTQVRIVGQSGSTQVLQAAVGPSARRGPEAPRAPRPNIFLRIAENTGRAIVELGVDIVMGMHILGATIRGAQLKSGRRHAVNPAAIATQIDRMGIGAIPVIILMSTIVGAIIAQQGAFQLRYFGAEIFVVDLVGILVLRELGVLLTAIMIAGRSGSAITAEIGSMKMREEVDALTVIGLNPIGVLVFPRLVALIVVLPCLTVLANFSAIIGAMTVGWFYSGISPASFLERMRDAIDLGTVFAGLLKAPFMAIIIGIVASVEGLQVGGSAESLGRQVTNSVVKSIFIVIVVDGLFAMFYAAINF